MKNPADLLTASGIPWSAGASLKKLSYWHIGGNADYLAEPRSVAELRAVREIAAETGLQSFIIGHGSNLLFDDAGYRGMIIKLGSRFASYEIDGTRVRADAGLWVPNLARACAARGLTGLEHTVGIPGNLGGLIYMNGGSMRRNIGDNVVSVDILDEDNEPRTLSRGECGFSYRCSAFQGTCCVITGATLLLEQSDPAAVRTAMLAVLEERKAKFPLEYPNCGSVFSNTPALYEQWGPPGKLIDRAGLKGLRCGNVRVSRKHANFIVNLGGASSSDVFRLVGEIRETMFHRTGFWLRCEVIYVPPTGRPAPLDEFL